jgi:uncharacterized protein
VPVKLPQHILDRLLWPALLVLLAAAGYALVSVPPQIAARWKDLADQPTAGRIFLGMVVAGALLLLFVWGSLAWMVVARMRKLRGSKRPPPPSELTRAQQEREVRKQLDKAEKSAQRADARGGGEQIRRDLEDLQSKIQKRRLEIAAFGAISSGKSALLNALLGEDRFATDPRGGTTVGKQEFPLPMESKREGMLILRDTPGLGEVLGQRRGDAAAEHAREADLVLFVVTGPLRDFEFESLRALLALEKRVLVCLNKEDWYTPEDSGAVLRQLREQAASLPRPVPEEDVIAVRARPAAQKRVRILPGGREHEETTMLPPDIAALETRLREVVQRDGRELLLANLLLRSRAVAARAKQASKGAPS